MVPETKTRNMSKGIFYPASFSTNWQDASLILPRKYICGYCNSLVASERGFFTGAPTRPDWAVYICPHCRKPTFVNQHGQQTPGVKYGCDVEHIPDEIRALYDEARDCIQSNAFTAATLCSRKILMHLAVENGAPPNQRFIDYVEFLSDGGYVPSGGKEWIDYIRLRGNDANHEIKIVDATDAKRLISFIEMLLKCIYEFPESIKTIGE